MSLYYDVIVCGSGPAGLSAGLAAAERGAHVLILEKLPRPAVKLMASGGGRCNFSNTLPDAKFMEAFGRNGRFMTDALRIGGRDYFLDLLKRHGIGAVVEEGIKYFPDTQSAADVRDAFLDDFQKAGGEIKTGVRISKILRSEDGCVSGIVSERGDSAECGAFILAAGGMAMTTLGGSSSGLDLARSVGHTVVKPLPAMSPLLVREKFIGTLAGVSLPAAKLSFVADRKRVSADGELVFTHDGLSGPAPLDLSAAAYRVFERDGDLSLEFAPVGKMDPPKWRAYFQEVRTKEPIKYLRTSLAKFMPHSLADALAAEAGVLEYRNGELTNVLIEDLSRFFAAVPLTVSSLYPLDKAMAMSGGVSLKEVNPKNMESRIVPGLYFAGEILDLAGPCGGFHIQVAVASGRLAGSSAAERKNTEV